MSISNGNSKRTLGRKWPWIVLLSIIGMVGIARLSLMTDPVHRWVRQTMVDTANSRLRPTLSVGRLSGDLWREATLTDVVLTEAGRRVASVDTVHLEYDILSYFKGAFEIREGRMVQPFLELEQQPDSTFNVQQWLAAAPADTSAGVLAFSVGELLIKRGRIEVKIPRLRPDSSFVVNNLSMASSLEYYGDSYEISVDDLGFRVENTRLDAPISFSAAAAADESSITLKKLALATGHSMLKASGRADLSDSTGRLVAGAHPLGWQDLAAYLGTMPVRKDMNVSVKLNGTPKQLSVMLNANAAGIDQLAITGNFSRDSLLVLSTFNVSADRLDLETFLGDTAMPRLQALDLRGRGRVPVQAYREGTLEGTISAQNIRQAGYRLDALEGTFDISGSRANLRLEPVVGRERLTANASISGFWDERPAVHVRLRGDGINPAHWMRDQNYEGSLTFSGELSGQGWIPQNVPWRYRVDIQRSTLMGQPIREASLSGRFSVQSVTNNTRIAVGEGALELQAEVRQLQQVPRFSYHLRARQLNIAQINGLGEYPSSVNGVVEGQGRGSTLQNLHMQAKARIDSSIFRGETIDRFELDSRLADSILTVSRGNLISSIADADFSGQLNILNYFDRDNNLVLDVQLKDASTFAAAADVEVLAAAGSIEGALKPAGRDTLVFDGSVDMQEVNYDNRFTADRLRGGVRVELAEQPSYLLDFDISRPSVASVPLQNITLRTEGRWRNSAARGSYQLTFSSTREGSISQAGGYHFTEDSVALDITDLELTSSLRTLSLTDPFHVRFAGGVLKTDTLHMRSADGEALLELAVPYVDSLRQQAYLKGENLNLTVIQDAILDEAYFEGLLFGEVHVDRTDTSLVASGDVVMSNIQYRQAELDTLLLRADVNNKRLQGRMELHQNNRLIAEGNLDIPFEVENPAELDDGFFQKPVSGHLKLHALELDRFRRLLKDAGYENTEGTVRFNGSLEGQAGNPRMNAMLSVRDARISGMPVDSLVAAVNYRHDRSELNLNAVLVSLKQKALEAHAEMPLNVDLRNLEVALPGLQDSIAVDIRTNQFNLQALNSFINRDKYRNIEGRVDGNVQIRGPRSDLQASGEVNLRRGAVQLVDAGIRLDHIESTISLKPDRIILENMRMESGSGRLRASGELGLEQLVPGELEVRIDARNFKAANTKEYSALVNMDMEVNGRITRPEVSGTLEMVNGFVVLDNFGEKSVEQVELDTTLAPETQLSLYDSLSLDLDLQLNRRFYIRNRRNLEMEIELDGQLDLLKNAGSDLQVFGTLNTTDGYAEPLGKRFELEEGSLTFTGPPDNPRIFVRTLYEPPQAEQEVQIWYIIEGTVEDPQFRYDSNPPMDLAGIISYTLFGQPYFKLNPAEQSVASFSSSNAAADLAMEVLVDRLESVATRRLGIDVVRIENTRVGGDSGTSITTGWYINPKVFFAIQNVITGSTPTTGFYLEYYLQEDLKLILSQGNENRQGIDLQWEHDY